MADAAGEVSMSSARTNRRAPADWPVFSLISQWIVRNAATKATVGYVIILTWASLVASSTAVPTHDEWFVPHSRPLASHDWFLFDIASNIALYVPIGALTAITLIQRRSGTVMALFRSVLAAAALSLCLETLQIYVPNRVSSAVDWGANIIGAGFGAVLGVLFEQTVRAVWRGVVRPMLLNPVLFAPAAWLAFVVVAAVWPIELPLRYHELALANPPSSGALFGRWTLHLEKLWSLAPMSVAYLWELQRTIEYGLELLTAGVLFAVLGVFWVAALRREFGVGARSAFGATAWIGAVTCMCLALVRSVLPSAGFDPTWALFGLAGLMVGAGSEAVRKNGGIDDTAPIWSPRGESRRLVLLAVLLFIVVCETAPFLIRVQDFSPATMLGRVDWVPFHAYLMQRLPRGADQIGERLVRWGILGFIVASGWRHVSWSTTKERVTGLALRTLLFASVLEAIQTLMPTRTPDMTDILLAVTGVAGGALLRCARPRSARVELGPATMSMAPSSR